MYLFRAGVGMLTVNWSFSWRLTSCKKTSDLNNPSLVSYLSTLCMYVYVCVFYLFLSVLSYTVVWIEIDQYCVKHQ